MSETNDISDEKKSPSIPCLKTIIISLKIFSRNKQIFVSIFILLSLPLSLLLFSLSLSSRPIKSHIFHLESIAILSPTRFEARHVWKESRADALSLLRLKAHYFLPSYILSLLAAITAVNSASLSFDSKRTGVHATLSAVRLTWRRLVVTDVVVYVVLLLYAEVPRVLAAVAGRAGLRLLVFVIGSGIEIYLMAVLGLGLVVSVLEERVGLDAIRVGSDLMEGRRVSGWALSGLGVLGSGWIGWKLEKIMDGLDLTHETVWTVVMSGWDKVGLICGYGLLVVWSYIVTTVFYCECRKRHVIRGESETFVTV